MFRDAKDFLRMFKASVIFLSKTHCDANRLNSLKLALNFGGSYFEFVSSMVGGLCVLWAKDVTVPLNHIDARIEYEGKFWRFTGLYEFPEAHSKKFTCDLINSLNNMFDWS